MKRVKNIPKPLRFALIGLFWLIIWHLISLLINNDILLCSPIVVAQTLARNIITLAFWSTILYSFLRIAVGFFIAFLLGLVVGVLSWRFPLISNLLTPIIIVMKSVPIVCFVVLLLIWVGSSLVSAIAVFLVVFPAFSSSISEGLNNQDKNLAEMLRVFRVPTFRKFLAFHWQTVLPYTIASARVAVGVSWKSGVAAELIGMPLGSIGERIYQSKILLSSADLLSWTVVIIIVALVCERLFLHLLRKSSQWAWKVALPQIPEKKQEGRSKRTRRSTHSLVVANLTKSYNDMRVFEDISLSFEPNTRTALADPSGSGKTTFLRLLAGLEKPDAGTVKKPEELSMVFQEARVFENYSAIDNIRLVAGDFISVREIRAFLSKVLPSESLDLPLSQLSGGMRRRVELCRALIMPSKAVLLDEPFVGLDDSNRALAYQLITASICDRVLIISSHDLDDALALQARTIRLRDR